jgi:hypothetical protein
MRILAIPITPEGASALLTWVERIANKGPAAHDFLPDLVSFLGANSAVWTPVNRARLRRVLACFDSTITVKAIVAMLRINTRTDILDAAELALRSLDTGAAPYMRFLARESDLNEDVRACILRAAHHLFSLVP